MAEVLGLGVTHYPPLSGTDDNLTKVFRGALADPKLPAELRDPASWPARAREEWADDEGVAAGKAHRAALREGFRQVRTALDEFQPDVVLIWGDDQYENFREDIVPPYAVLAYEDTTVHPWRHADESSNMKGKANVWGESEETSRVIRGHRPFARHLAEGLLSRGIDVPYAYKPLHHPGFAHAFLNTVLYLDYDREGFDYPVVAFPLNCYGRRVISFQGNISPLGVERELDPPSPAPSRIMDVGATVARICAESPYRVALVASSSWSHSFLVDSTFRLFPDSAADERMYEALVSNDYGVWETTTLEDAEKAGQQELLNWWALVGAMRELGKAPSWTSFAASNIFVSNKVFAIYGGAE
ncbi:MULTISPECIES: extradiol ring-cleavage dioxygenase [Rhodococcus]|uniref:Extradiol ring-cleavage dioxygenase n=1 Tax=Rhodococcus oxybenzonivorans TaxID=1990687 RepID=A0AAE4UZZ3_9NOCA|nr:MULTISPECIES: extradiol ring-cleavage dioxygenase [Rhodococcus]MDV7241796.1 extradiol ring-cleavage dioxygenase [Rhodococcus oxybenzonivorans]MDV7265439.1 extradiol ring-cleavage dioxygenase [Rhodococcus oxybenzonivorans]MDV7273670.1 extradiol ring-cleavage dioxygenase [Rhodococcus oxybenzonivorans]MDV7334078.1 extradiol ring-cleavage dioxygenase [Rhodococcus oxybenzonivorans]MDV7343497.1 extradiol ring-cleavage dioxygenase [Rhodococcus oxybenzonivorans]